ncbi:hypothetical protein KM868_09725 [Micrococcus luteus]|nr:hypothetical protein [Micrococcus luteus]
MFHTQRKVVAGILSFIFLGLIVYGAMTNFFIPKGGALVINVFDTTDFVKEYPKNFTVIEGEVSVIHGIQNGISLSGRVIWDSLRSTWWDFLNAFPEGGFQKILWLIFGLVIEFFKNFFISAVVFFIIIYKLIFWGGASYKLALIIAAFIPTVIAVLISIIQPEDDSPSSGKSEPTVLN